MCLSNEVTRVIIDRSKSIYKTPHVCMFIVFRHICLALLCKDKISQSLLIFLRSHFDKIFAQSVMELMNIKDIFLSLMQGSIVPMPIYRQPIAVDEDH